MAQLEWEPVIYVIPYRYRAKAQGVLETITQEQEWVITVPDQPKIVFYSNSEDYCINQQHNSYWSSWASTF